VVEEEVLSTLVTALELSPTTKSVQQRGIEALSLLCLHHPQHAELARKRGAASLVMVALARYPALEMLQWQGLHVLGCLFMESSVGCGEALGAVVAALKRTPDSAIIQQRGVAALGLFCFNNPQHAELTREQGAMPLVVAALARYPTNEVLQWRGLHVLGSLLTTSSVGCEEALGAVVAALARSPGSEIIQHRGIEALSRFCFDQPPYAARVHEQGAAPLVVAALARYPAADVLQWRGLHVLGSLFFQSPVGCEEALVAVVAALVRSPDSETIQWRGLEALGRFCPTVVREQGVTVPLVVAALVQYPAMEVLQWHGLDVLGSLFTTSPVVCEEALGAVIAVLTRSPGSETLQQKGIEILGLLCYNNPRHATLAREQKAMLLVGATLAQYPAVEMLQWHGLCVLESLFLQSPVVCEETVVAVVAVLARSLDSERLQRRGVKALSLFCLDHPQYAVLAHERGAAPLVVAALARYPVEDELQWRGLYVLGCLFSKSPTGCEEALGAVVTALERFPDSDIVHQRGLEALGLFCCGHPVSAALARDKGAVPLIVAALTRYPTEEEIQWRGLHVLGCLFAKTPTVCDVALDAVVAALVRTLDSESIQSTGIEALSIFCSGHPRHVTLAREKGVIPFLVAARARHRQWKCVYYSEKVLRMVSTWPLPTTTMDTAPVV
jgi:hypothetical protein